MLSYAGLSSMAVILDHGYYKPGYGQYKSTLTG